MLWMEWLSLFIRWFHVIAGVAWIGASFYFIWLDNNLETPPKWKQDKGIKGDLWAVHGGGFYEVAKYRYGPKTIPQTLHWFKWEAYTTWLSGFALLILVYYFGASAYLIDPSVKPLSQMQAIALGLSVIFIGLLIYEIACRSVLARYPKWFALLLIAMLSLASYLACQWFSGRGAYIHVGALIGTIMAANVFLQIIPSQKAMVTAVEHGRKLNPRWGEGAKLRSVHNNYLTLPLLFIMISNHYPMTYQHNHNWLVLMAIGLVSAWIRHFFNLRHQGQTRVSILVTGAIMMAVIALLVSMPQQGAINKNLGDTALENGPTLSALDKKVQGLIHEHCLSCHSQQPKDAMFASAPLGLTLDNWTSIVSNADLIVQRTAISKDMPFLNKTKMTEQQRQTLLDWQQHRDNVSKGQSD